MREPGNGYHETASPENPPAAKAPRLRGPTRSELQDKLTEVTHELTEVTRHQVAILEVLRAIASSPHDLQPIFDAILDSATRLCRADIGSLRLSEESGLRRVAVRGDPLLVSQAWSSFPVLAEQGILNRFATSGLPTHIPDLTALEGDRRDDDRITLVNAGLRTGLFVPLLKDNEVVGIITLGRKELQPFTDKQISLRKPPLPWRAPVASGNIARGSVKSSIRCRALSGQ